MQEGDAQLGLQGSNGTGQGGGGDAELFGSPREAAPLGYGGKVAQQTRLDGHDLILVPSRSLY